MVVGLYILIITLIVNGLNVPTKRQIGWADENMCMYALPHTTSLYFTKTTIQQKNLQSLFDIQMHIRITLKYFEKYKCPGTATLLQNTRCVSHKQACLKTSGLYDDLLLLSHLFHFFYFIFSAPISFCLCSPISPSLLFFYVLSQAFIKCSRKDFVYIPIKIYIIYIFQQT